MPFLLACRLSIPRRVGRVLALLPVVAALAVVLAGPAAAQRTTNKAVVEAYSQPSDPRIRRAQELIDEGKVREGVSVMREALGGRTPDERAVLLRFLAQYEVGLGNVHQAIKDIEASFATGALTKLEMKENYLFLGRLYLALDSPDHTQAIENLRHYILLASDPHPDAFYYLALALSQTNRCEEAIPNVQKAIRLIESVEGENQWYANAKDKDARRKKYRELMLHCCSKVERQCAPTAD